MPPSLWVGNIDVAEVDEDEDDDDDDDLLLATTTTASGEAAKSVMAQNRKNTDVIAGIVPTADISSLIRCCGISVGLVP